MQFVNYYKYEISYDLCDIISNFTCVIYVKKYYIFWKYLYHEKYTIILIYYISKREYILFFVFFKFFLIFVKIKIARKR